VTELAWELLPHGCSEEVSSKLLRNFDNLIRDYMVSYITQQNVIKSFTVVKTWEQIHVLDSELRTSRRNFVSSISVVTKQTVECILIQCTTSLYVVWAEHMQAREIYKGSDHPGNLQLASLKQSLHYMSNISAHEGICRFLD